MDNAAPEDQSRVLNLDRHIAKGGLAQRFRSDRMPSPIYKATSQSAKTHDNARIDTIWGEDLFIYGIKTEGRIAIVWCCMQAIAHQLPALEQPPHAVLCSRRLNECANRDRATNPCPSEFSFRSPTYHWKVLIRSRLNISGDYDMSGGVPPISPETAVSLIPPETTNKIHAQNLLP